MGKNPDENRYAPPVQIRLNEYERDLIMRAAKKVGAKHSTWIREVVLAKAKRVLGVGRGS